MQLSRAAATAAAVGLLLCIAAVPTARAERDTLAMSDWALTNKAFGAPHERREYELPDGVKQNSPEANNYWTRWLQCSTLVTWCTVEEVLCGCTYEPTGTWYRGRFPWNSGKDEKIWPYCQPGLAEFYANSTSCDEHTKENASCKVTDAMRPFNGNFRCVQHEVCSGGGYCLDKVRSTPAPL